MLFYYTNILPSYLWKSRDKPLITKVNTFIIQMKCSCHLHRALCQSNYSLMCLLWNEFHIYSYAQGFFINPFLFMQMQATSLSSFLASIPINTANSWLSMLMKCSINADSPKQWQNTMSVGSLFPQYFMDPALLRWLYKLSYIPLTQSGNV